MNNLLTLPKKDPQAWAAIGLIIGLMIVLLYLQGRTWICSCGRVDLWVSNIWSSDNSQHIFDPYSFSHVLHGLLFWAVLVWLLPQLSLSWQLALSVLIESSWEVGENSSIIIDRYREATLALGYNGDTIINSLADVFCCMVGFALAQRIGYKYSALLFVLTELILILWIRDSFLLNVLMLIYPIEAIKLWQMGQ